MPGRHGGNLHAGDRAAPNAPARQKRDPGGVATEVIVMTTKVVKTYHRITEPTSSPACERLETQREAFNAWAIRTVVP